MHRMTARSLLFLMLITVFGQVMAQSCADLHGQMAVASTMEEMDESAGHQRTHSSPSAEEGQHHDHCGDGMTVPQTQTSHCDAQPTADDCGQGCSCCPGHCASALPAAETKAAQAVGCAQISSYHDIASSPEPESAIRPPIPA